MSNPLGRSAQLSKTQKFFINAGIFIFSIVTFFAVIMTIMLAAAWWSDRKPALLAVAIASLALPIGLGWLVSYLSSLLKKDLPPERVPANCQCCGLPTPTAKVSLHRHIGAVVLMFRRSYTGYFCKPCISRVFWQYTLVTFFFGWWGLISAIITPVVLINNVVMFIRGSRIQPIRPREMLS